MKHLLKYPMSDKLLELVEASIFAVCYQERLNEGWSAISAIGSAHQAVADFRDGYEQYQQGLK